MTSFTLSPLPSELTWINEPVSFATPASGSLDITAGPVSDWFHNPAEQTTIRNSPVALFTPAAGNFSLSARVNVEFKSTFDAGVLLAYLNEQTWAKLCFEFSPQNQAMVVSVVTRGRSDDCNSVVIGAHTVYLRLYRQADALAFHYSTDGQTWHFVRFFTIGSLDTLKVGFAAQSPTGQGCTAHFSQIDFQYRSISDLRDGT